MPPTQDQAAISVPKTERICEAALVVLVPALAVYAVALVSPAIFNDSDTFWHIRAGEWMLTHHAIVTRDPFSLTFAGRPWAAQEWLAEIALASAFLLFGWSGVAVMTGLAMGTAILLLTLYVGRRADPVATILIVVVAASCVMPDYLARPHILALPFMTAWIIGLVRASDARRAPPWQFLPLMTIWANLHGGFIFGLALIPPFAFEAILASRNSGTAPRIAKQWVLFGLASLLAVLLNPRGMYGLLFPFALMQVHSLSSIGEWQSLDLRQFSPVEFAMLATVFYVVWKGIKVSPVRVFLILALFHLSLLHARYGMLLGATAAIVLAEPIGRSRKPEREAWILQAFHAPVFFTLAVAVAVSAAFRVAYPEQHNEGPMSPEKALAAVPASLWSRPMFNNYSFGGFLIFQGVRPFVDSRADFYGDEFLLDYARAMNGDEGTIDRLFKKYGVAWTMLEPADPLVSVLEQHHGWRRLYADRFAIVQAAPESSRSAVRSLQAQAAGNHANAD